MTRTECMCVSVVLWCNISVMNLIWERVKEKPGAGISLLLSKNINEAANCTYVFTTSAPRRTCDLTQKLASSFPTIPLNSSPRQKMNISTLSGIESRTTTCGFSSDKGIIRLVKNPACQQLSNLRITMDWTLFSYGEWMDGHLSQSWKIKLG